MKEVVKSKQLAGMPIVQKSFLMPEEDFRNLGVGEVTVKDPNSKWYYNVEIVAATKPGYVGFQTFKMKFEDETLQNGTSVHNTMGIPIIPISEITEEYLSGLIENEVNFKPKPRK